MRLVKRRYCELCDMSTITRMFDQTFQTFGGVDIVVKCAAARLKSAGVSFGAAKLH